MLSTSVAALLIACGPTLAQQEVLQHCADKALSFESRHAACSSYASDESNPIEARSLALGLRALAAIDVKRNTDAYLDADLALKLDPHNWLAVAARGWSHLHAGRFEEARSDFYKVGRHDSARARILSNLGLSALAWEFESFALTRQLAGDVIKTEPGNIQALYLRGVSSAALGDFAAALADADALILVRPDSADGYELKGFTYHSLAFREGHAGDYALSLQAYEQAGNKRGQFSAGLLRRHAWLLATGPGDIRDPVKAVDLARQGMDEAKRFILVPKHLAQFRHTLAVALAVNGRQRDAEIELEAVMELFPGSRSRFQKVLADAGYLKTASSATLYELLGAINACLETSCAALSVPLVYKTL